MPMFDIWDQGVLTELTVRPIQTRLETQPRLGDQIAPVNPIQSRIARIRVAETHAFGIGSFKAPDATPVLVSPFKRSLREEAIELALLEEMHRINGEDWIKLNSTDLNVQREAANDLVERGQIMVLRNERLSEWMRWEAFKGSILIRYPVTNSELFVDYGYVANQLPTSTVAWTDIANSDPLGDIDAWQQTVADNSGFYGLRVHLNSNTWKWLLRNEKIKNQLTFEGRPNYIVREGDIQGLVREGTTFVIYDGGYRPESAGTDRKDSAVTRFLPDGKVLVTTDYTIDGERIADTLDGQVLVSASYNSVDIRQGPQSEVILDHMSKNHYLRQASARIPRLIHPECFLYATAY